MHLLLEFLSSGNMLMVTRVDRQARSIKDLQNIVYALNQQGVTFRAIEQFVGMRSAAGTAFLIAAKLAIADDLATPLARMSDEGRAFIGSTLTETFNRSEVLACIRDYFRKRQSAEERAG